MMAGPSHTSWYSNPDYQQTYNSGYMKDCHAVKAHLHEQPGFSGTADKENNSKDPNINGEQRRRNRQEFSCKQKDKLEEAFQRYRFLSREQRWQLAQNLKLSEKQIAEWFIRRRHKVKQRGWPLSSYDRFKADNYEVVANTGSSHVPYPTDSNTNDEHPQRNGKRMSRRKNAKLEEVFQRNNFISKEELWELAVNLNLPLKKIAEWFHRRREMAQRVGLPLLETGNFEADNNQEAANTGSLRVPYSTDSNTNDGHPQGNSQWINHKENAKLEEIFQRNHFNSKAEPWQLALNSNHPNKKIADLFHRNREMAQRLELPLSETVKSHNPREVAIDDQLATTGSLHVANDGKSFNYGYFSHPVFQRMKTYLPTTENQPHVYLPYAQPTNQLVAPVFFMPGFYDKPILQQPLYPANLQMTGFDSTFLGSNDSFSLNSVASESPSSDVNCTANRQQAAFNLPSKETTENATVTNSNPVPKLFRPFE